MRASGILIAVFAAPCGPVLDGGTASDHDGDGISNGDERSAGTDPQLPDSDGDGLMDGDEADFGTNPLAVDSDGDGLSDGDEILYGRDPLDPKSKGYKGRYPMQTVAIKDQIASKGKPGPGVAVGARFPRYVMDDNFGQVVDLYDFAGHGVPVIIDVSAQWCPPCKAMAGFMDGDDAAVGNDAALITQLSPLRDAVAAGELLWVTILPENNSGAPASVKTAKEWHGAYPTKGVPVMADTAQQASDYAVAVTGAWPTFALLNDSMKVQSITAGLDFEEMLTHLEK